MFGGFLWSTLKDLETHFGSTWPRENKYKSKQKNNTKTPKRIKKWVKNMWIQTLTWGSKAWKEIRSYLRKLFFIDRKMSFYRFAHQLWILKQPGIFQAGHQDTTHRSAGNQTLVISLFVETVSFITGYFEWRPFSQLHAQCEVFPWQCCLYFTLKLEF